MDLGMIPLSIADNWKNSYVVMLDGKLIGLIDDGIISRITDKLRLLKIQGQDVTFYFSITYTTNLNFLTLSYHVYRNL